jgi:DNA-binding SARP family transcriptional activator
MLGLMPRTSAAKFVAPRAEQIVHRRRLSLAIERALGAGVCWLAAPAGYGKTTAVADYVRAASTPRVWYRTDEGDQDVASFFHYMTSALPRIAAQRRLPVFGPEYADQPEAFARRYFRSWFGLLKPGTIVVLDDLHRAETPTFQKVLRVLLQETPEEVRCICLSRMLPGRELTELKLQGRLRVLDQSVLKFTEREARALLAGRLKRATAAVNLAAARGWAAGLVLLAERASTGEAPVRAPRRGGQGGSSAFAALAEQMFDTLPEAQRDVLLKLSVLPEMRPEVARAFVGEDAADALIEVLQRRQLLVTRGESAEPVFHLHDLLRDFLQERIERDMSSHERARLRERAAELLSAEGWIEAAVALAVKAQAWALVRRLALAAAPGLVANGRRATLIEWCGTLPTALLDAQLCYWLGVANMHDDAAAEVWFARAWDQFCACDDVRGQMLTAAHAVLAKSDSWRTHSGLDAWTGRLLALLDAEAPPLDRAQQLLIWNGMLRAVDFAADYRSDAPAVKKLTRALLDMLNDKRAEDAATLRLQVSATLIDHAGSTGQQDVFEQAVDSVLADLREGAASAWSLGLWLVAFGAVSGRYFAYARRGFPYAAAEDALRAAIRIGEQESLRAVEFGALYHLQLQLKGHNDLSGFAALIKRLAEIADSRHTTQVAVVADCQAALHTLHGEFAAAYRACERFNAAIEAANEPPIERWPHFITQFQVLLADRKPQEASAFLEGVLPLFDGAVRQRTLTCIHIARALAAKWDGRTDYPLLLREGLEHLRAANWPAILLNAPGLLAELCADALEHGLDAQFVRALIERRRLAPPGSRPPAWPWALKVFVLGEFRLERGDAPVQAGPKAPTRALDIVRMLAISPDQGCSLARIEERLWPDADGDQARASCEQALHRLRKLLGDPDLIVQREGALRFARERVWVDAAHWEARVRQAVKGASGEEATSLFHAFTGPLFQNARVASWALPVAERVRSRLIDLAVRAAHACEQAGDLQEMQTICLRALDFYPTSERCYQALLRARLAQGDVAGAVEDYRRYERVLSTTTQTRPSTALRALVEPWLRGAPASVDA